MGKKNSSVAHNNKERKSLRNVATHEKQQTMYVEMSGEKFHARRQRSVRLKGGTSVPPTIK